VAPRELHGQFACALRMRKRVHWFRRAFASIVSLIFLTADYADDTDSDEELGCSGVCVKRGSRYSGRGVSHQLEPGTLRTSAMIPEFTSVFQNIAEGYR